MKRLIFSFVLLLAACQTPVSGDPRLALTLLNDSDQTLRCLLNFSHWTTIDLPALAPGESTSVDLWRAPDASLYQPRTSDGRQMMLETLVCGFEPDWSQSHGHISLQPARESEQSAMTLTCQAGPKPDCRW